MLNRPNIPEQGLVLAISDGKRELVHLYMRVYCISWNEETPIIVNHFDNYLYPVLNLLEKFKFGLKKIWVKILCIINMF